MVCAELCLAGLGWAWVGWGGGGWCGVGWCLVWGLHRLGEGERCDVHRVHAPAHAQTAGGGWGMGSVGLGGMMFRVGWGGVRCGVVRECVWCGVVCWRM